MAGFETRFMRPDDWAYTQIERGRYFNKDYAVTGYRRADGLAGNPLHPACVLKDRLRETHKRLQETCKAISLSRYHLKMPYWDVNDPNLPRNYAFVQAPERLTTTSVAVIMVGRDRIRDAEMGFYFDGKTLPTLRERMRGVCFRGLAGNLGYYMTPGLIEGLPWSHNARYPEFPLAVAPAYIGFHLFRDRGTGKVYGSFQGAHPAAVGIRNDGQVEIIPRLEIERYRVTLWGAEFEVHSINNPDLADEVMLFTPGLWTSEIGARVESWETFAPEIPLSGRINVFIANKGDGRVPVEEVIAVWPGRAPLPSFGAVLSFERKYFEKLFANIKAFSALHQRLGVVPCGGTNFDDYAQMMGGFVPAVVNGRHIYSVETVDQVKKYLNDYGNAISPIAQCGRESRNFDLRVREPVGLLAQTKDRIGWVLFDGRHELSIGASVVDVARILKMLEDKGALGGKIEQAIFIDGGSAMKAYAIESDGENIALDLLNRVATGSRNGPGADPDGLNLYTLLKLSL